MSTSNYYTITPADFTPLPQKTGLNRRMALRKANQEIYRQQMIELSAELNPDPPYGWIYFDPAFFGVFSKPG